MRTGWLLWDQHKVGTYFQCKAVEACLKGLVAFEEKPIRLSKWVQWLPWRVGFSPPYPDVVIAGGRQAVHVAWWLRRHVKTVIVQNPRRCQKSFTVVIAPKHDQLKPTENLITTLGSLCAPRVFDADVPWDLPRPWCGIILGGNSRHHLYTQDDVDLLIQQIETLPENYSFIVTPSRRTPAQWLHYFQHRLSHRAVWTWDGHSVNPYSAILHHSDILVVTNDSISMLSEACSAGPPVYIGRLDLKTPRIASFSESLVAKGYAMYLGEQYPFTPVAILNERERIRPLIIKALDL